jgi:hypothetical protein
VNFEEMVGLVYESHAEDAAESDAEREFFRSPRRIDEAREAAPCAQRFVELEFDPPKGEGAGRGPAAHASTAAKILDKQIAEMDAEALEWLRGTVLGALGSAYASFGIYETTAGAIPEPELGQRPAELWERWMLRIASDALEKAVPEASRKPLNQLAGAHFEGTLKRHGVTRGGFRGISLASKVGMLSGFYGRAGQALRLLQCTREFDVDPHRSQVKALSDWPFAAA